MASETATEAQPIAATEDMELESTIPVKREREEDEELEADGQNGAVLKKQKAADEKSVEEARMEKLAEEGKKGVEGERENTDGPVTLGPKTFGSSIEMFDYFYGLLHTWPVNISTNRYEYLVLLDLIMKGHQEPDKKIGSGVNAFQIRYHPVWQSRCFFVIREDTSFEDFSFRKCVDQILPLPENLKIKTDVNQVLGGKGNKKKGGGGGGGGRGGGRGRGRGRGGNSRR